jgi:hypothetical protein
MGPHKDNTGNGAIAKYKVKLTSLFLISIAYLDTRNVESDLQAGAIGKYKVKLMFWSSSRPTCEISVNKVTIWPLSLQTGIIYSISFTLYFPIAPACRSDSTFLVSR